MFFREPSAYEKALDGAVKIGENLGDLLHKNAKGIIKGLIVAGAIVVVGGLFMLIAFFKHSFGASKK